MSFKKLSRRGVMRQARFKLTMLEGAPELICNPATEANPAYYNRFLARGAKNTKALRTGDPTVDMLTSARADDRGLYPGLVITGWDPAPLDDDGNAVPWSVEACREFLRALPDWIFDTVRDWASDPRNFCGDDAPPTTEQAEELGKA